MTTLQRWTPVYARVALGAAFLSGIMSRFGLWGDGVGFMPAVKEPLDYSVFSASAGALLLAVHSPSETPR